MINNQSVLCCELPRCLIRSAVTKTSDQACDIELYARAAASSLPCHIELWLWLLRYITIPHQRL